MKSKSQNIIRYLIFCGIILLLSCAGEDESLLTVMTDHFEEIDFSLDDIS